MPKNMLLKAMGIFLLVVVFRGNLFAQNAQLSVRPGTTLAVTGNHLVLNNTNLQGDGTFNASAATVWVTGSSNNTLGGAGIPLFGTLQLNTSTGVTTSLTSTVKIGSLVNFQQGLIDLNGQQLQLTGNAFLQGESEVSHIIGPSGGSIIASATGVNNPNQLNLGQLGAVLTSGTNLGNLTVSRMTKPATNPGNSSLSGIDRVYLLQPQNNSGLNATLRFNYLDADLNGKNPSTLSLWKSNDGIGWALVGADTRNTVQKYVEKTAINDLSFWTLTDLINALPVTLVSFKASCEGGHAVIQWQTGIESGVDYFLVEGSADGSQWTPLQKVAATNEPLGSAYSWQDDHASANSFYRLEIVNQSGSFSYSPVFRGACSDVPLPFTLYPNPAGSQSLAQLSVRESGPALLQIADMSGKILYRAQWNLSSGINTFILPLSAFAAGEYIVDLLLPHSILQTKLIKK